MLNVPFALIDLTTLTEAGYVGADPDSGLLDLYHAANGDLVPTEIGIMALDEIDKKAKPKVENMSITRDVSGVGVQEALLKIIEGTTVHVSLSGGRKHPQAETVAINTKNILFVGLGAFNGLDNIIERRVRGKGLIGYNSKEMSIAQKKASARVQPEDLIEFGLLPELVGRLPVVSTLDALTEKDMLSILTEPKNALIKQYEKMVLLDGAKIKFEEDAKKKMAEIAWVRGVGARGLRAVVEEVLLDIMFNLKPGQNIVVTKQMVSAASNGDNQAA